jgi:spermidine/putrescine transport system ATP-binding protein
VAAFLGTSNLLEGEVAGDGTVKVAGIEVRVEPGALAGRSGAVAVGIRPEKIRLGGDGVNRLDGTVKESAYIGVSTQYIVETRAGELSVYVQNAGPRAGFAEPGDQVSLSWDPEAAFVVDDERDGRTDDPTPDT